MACLITQPDKHQQNEAKESFRKQHMAAVPLGRRMYQTDECRGADNKAEFNLSNQQKEEEGEGDGVRD